MGRRVEVEVELGMRVESFWQSTASRTPSGL